MFVINQRQKPENKMVTRSIDVVSITFLVCISSVTSWPKLACADPQVEPPFPSLFDRVGPNEKVSVKLVSEVLDSEVGYHTSFEYLDLELARAAYVNNYKTEQVTVLLNAKQDIAFTYKPYTCKTSAQNALTLVGLSNWSTKLKVSYLNQGEPVATVLRVFGVLGFWIYTSTRSKVYTKSQIVYSVSKNIHMVSHQWCTEDPKRKLKICLHFIDTASKGEKNTPLELTLEMVQVSSVEDGKPLKTYNVLSLNYELDNDAYDNVLQVPVGYGCLTSMDEKEFESKLAQKGRRELPFMSPKSHKLSLEVTGSKFVSSAGQTITRNSDTVFLELLQSTLGYYSIRIKSSSSDRKHIIDTTSRLNYAIDLVTSQCDISLFNPDPNEDDGIGVDTELSNQMHLNLSPEFIRNVFNDREGFRLVKTIQQRDTQTEIFYFERVSVGLLVQKPSRIVRRYVHNQDDSFTLESVSVMTLNEDSDQVLELWYISVVDYEPIDQAWPEIASEFDVADQCYINNDRMKDGRDYAWLEFTFPVSSRNVALLADHSETIKSRLHRKFSYLFSPNVIRFPQAEVAFEDESLVFRLLVLDYLPLEQRFEQLDSTSLKRRPGLNYQSLAPDLRHCAEICRLHKCHIVTYCSLSHTCVYTTQTKDDLDVELVPDKRCETYSDLFPKRVQSDSLQQIIARAQTIDYNPVALPELPEELRADVSANREASKKYLSDVLALLSKARPGLEKMTLITIVDERLIVLMPSGFRVEQDPLNELSSIDSVADEQTTALSSAFHEGTIMYRYKPEEIGTDHGPSGRLLNRLTYDQCALACADSKCGSFSYCFGRSECLITNINSTSLAHANDLTEPDSDCIIMQRDFLQNFDQFDNVFRPQIYQTKAAAKDASECALKCLSESSFRCLAFDFCETPGDIAGSAQATCFYQSSRHATNFEKPQSAGTGAGAANTGCTHYSRSHLADFNRIEDRELDDTFKERFDMSKFTGRTLFECANICSDLSDCSMFQFCFDPSQQQGELQSCEMIQSKLTSNESGDEPHDTGKYIRASNKCHLFTLRKDSIETQLKDLMLSFKGSYDEQVVGQGEDNQSTSSTFSYIISLYLSATLMSATIVGFVCIAKSTEFMRRRLGYS